MKRLIKRGLRVYFPPPPNRQSHDISHDTCSDPNPITYIITRYDKTLGVFPIPSPSKAWYLKHGSNPYPLISYFTNPVFPPPPFYQFVITETVQISTPKPYTCILLFLMIRHIQWCKLWIPVRPIPQVLKRLNISETIYLNQLTMYYLFSLW